MWCTSISEGDIKETPDSVHIEVSVKITLKQHWSIAKPMENQVSKHRAVLHSSHLAAIQISPGWAFHRGWGSQAAHGHCSAWGEWVAGLGEAEPRAAAPVGLAWEGRQPNRWHSPSCVGVVRRDVHHCSSFQHSRYHCSLWSRSQKGVGCKAAPLYW